MDDIDSVSKEKNSLENESKELAAALSTELPSSSSNKQIDETTDIVTGEQDEQSKEGDDEESNEDEDIYEVRRSCYVSYVILCKKIDFGAQKFRNIGFLSLKIGG